jgi:Ca-activated chloride channel family protein
VTLLAPIPAILAASVGGLVLVAYYLLKLRRRPVRISSTLLWEQAVKDLQVNAPFRWIRPSWLLLLQAIILGLLATALGRPAIHMESEPAQRVFLLIDRSASMAASDASGGGTRLDEAKKRATDIIDRMDRGGAGGGGGRSEGMVIAFAHAPQALTNLTGDKGALREAVNGIEPSDQPGDLRAALRLVEAMTAGSGDVVDETRERPRSEVVLISDGSFADTDSLSVAGALVRFERVGPATGPGTDGTSGPVLDNLGIVALSARRDYNDPSTVRVFVRVQNAGTAAAAVTLTLAVDGRVVSRVPVEVPGAPTAARAAGQSGVIGGEAPPSEGTAPAAAGGQASATMDFQETGAAVAVVSIGREDALASDNAAGVVLRPATRPAVLLVVPDPLAQGAGGEASTPASVAAQTDWLLEDVLKEMGLRSLRKVTASQFDGRGAEALDGVDLVIFDRVEPRALPPVPSISFGAGLPVPGLRVEAGEVGQRSGTYFASWRRSHPLLRDVSLDSVFVAQPMRMTLPDEGGGAGEMELARGRSGPLIALVERGLVRRLVVAFDLAQSTWPLNVGFPIFLAGSVDYLTLRGDAGGAGRAYTTTEPIEIGAAPGQKTVRLRDAAGAVRVSAPVVEEEGGPPRAMLGVIDRAGVYATEGAAADVPAVAVNLVDETESAIRVHDAVTIGGVAVVATREGRAPREVWEWFVLAAAVLLAIEWMVYARGVRA